MSVRRNVRSVTGGALVELAIVLPLLLIIFAGTVDFARVFYATISLTNAARAGAQYGSASLAKSLDSAGMQATAVAAVNLGRRVEVVSVLEGRRDIVFIQRLHDRLFSGYAPRDDGHRNGIDDVHDDHEPSARHRAPTQSQSKRDAARGELGHDYQWRVGRQHDEGCAQRAEAGPR
jgi:hypothetical protein